MYIFLPIFLLFVVHVTKKRALFHNIQINHNLLGFSICMVDQVMQGRLFLSKSNLKMFKNSINKMSHNANLALVKTIVEVLTLIKGVGRKLSFS